MSTQHVADAVANVSPTEALFSMLPSWWATFSSSMPDLRPEQSVEVAPSLPLIKSSTSNGRSWQKWLLLSTGACSSAGLAYAVFRRIRDHHAHVTVIETVLLPSDTSSDFVEIGMPLEGEVRLDCSTLSHCKYQLKFNSSLKLEHGRVRDERGTETAHKNNIAVTSVNKSELCDSWLSDYTGNLHFSPACVSNDALLMTYASVTHDSLQVAAAIKDCWVEPASSSITHRLSFNLHVYSSVMDLAISIILPKGSRILKISTGGKGAVSAINLFAPHELTWNVGTFSREGAPNTQKGSVARGRTRLTQEGATNDVGRVGYDVIPDLSVNGRARPLSQTTPSNLKEEADMSQTMGGAATLSSPLIAKLAEEQMMSMTDRSSEIVPFEMIYTINVREAEVELNRGRTASQAAAAFVANNRRERRQMERDRKRRAQRRSPQREQYRTHASVTEIHSDEEDIDDEHRLGADDALDASHISFNPSEHTPGVCLSYATQATASGLAVRKLLTTAEERNYNVLEDLLGPAPLLEEGAPTVLYSQKQRVARAIINTVANGFIDVRKRTRHLYRSLYSAITRTPVTLSAEEIAEEEERLALERPPADISSMYAPNVRVPPSIVKQMKQQDSPAFSNSLSATCGRNPFSDAGDDDFVHVAHSDAGIVHGNAASSVAFNLASADVVPVEAYRQPRETFVDKLIKQEVNSSPKLYKKVRYITRYSQQVRVMAQF